MAFSAKFLLVCFLFWDLKLLECFEIEFFWKNINASSHEKPHEDKKSKVCHLFQKKNLDSFLKNEIVKFF